MADKNILEQMLESLVNDDQAKAEELFHEYVVAKSREIYENLIEEEMDDEEEEEEVEEGSEADDEEEAVEEAFGDDEGDMGGDPTDDLAGELDTEMGDGEEPEEASEEELFQDLESIVDELQAKFDELKGVESGEHGDDFGDDEGDMGDEPMKDEFELETVREYVEKVAGGHGAEKKGQGEGQYSGTGSQSDRPNVNTKSTVAGKNDMGGTTANILSSKEDAATFANQGHLKGSSLFKGNPKEDNAGNINVPGGNAGKTAFKKKEPGHGAEKKGEAEGKFSGTGGSSGSVDKASLFRGRR